MRAARESWTPRGSRTGAVRYPYDFYTSYGDCVGLADTRRYSYDDLGNGTGAVRFEGPESPSQNRTASVRMLQGPYWAPVVPVQCCLRAYGH